MKKSEEEQEERINILISKLEHHLERLMIIDSLIKNISDDEDLGEAIRKLSK